MIAWQKQTFFFSPLSRQALGSTNTHIILVKGMMGVKVKVKVTLEQATKAQRGSSGIALLFLLPRR
jgi:hypothetical protein